MAKKINYKILYSKSARLQLKAAYQWLKQQAPNVADLWLDDFEKKIENIKNIPDFYPLALEKSKARQGIRQAFYGFKRGQYRILYKVVKHEIRIITIRHTSREILH